MAAYHTLEYRVFEALVPQLEKALKAMVDRESVHFLENFKKDDVLDTVRNPGTMLTDVREVMKRINDRVMQNAHCYDVFLGELKQNPQGE